MERMIHITQKSVVTFIIMIWVTILTVWAVNNITRSMDHNPVVSLQGIPTPEQPQNIVQVDKDTVWIFDKYSDLIKVITHDEDGYHLLQTKMDITNQ